MFELAKGPDAVGEVAARLGHEDVFEVLQRVANLPDDVPAPGVGHEDLGSGILEPEGELVGLPPRVERDADRARRRARPERVDPLEVVRRQQGHAVARLDTQPYEVGRHHADLLVVLDKGQPLLPLHDEFLVAMRLGDGDELPHRPQTRLIDLHRHAADRFCDDLERTSGAGERDNRVDQNAASRIARTL